MEGERRNSRQCVPNHTRRLWKGGVSSETPWAGSCGTRCSAEWHSDDFRSWELQRALWGRAAAASSGCVTRGAATAVSPCPWWLPGWLLQGQEEAPGWATGVPTTLQEHPRSAAEPLTGNRAGLSPCCLVNGMS